MGYATNATTYWVQLLALRGLEADTLAQCETLRREAGRCWTAMVAAHGAARLAARR